MNTYPREAVEFQPVAVTVDGVAVTSGVQFAVVSGEVRPVNWVAAVSLEGKIGVMVENLSPGSWKVWAKVVSNPETPVLDCGTFLIV